MKGISQAKKQFIDDNFYEGLDENELDKSKFNQLTTPHELHYLAKNHNWDNGVKLLQWIVESDICSEATALEIFWLSQPDEFQIYKLSETIKGDYAGNENEIFQLIKTILTNFENNLYKKTDIHFDPTIYTKLEPKVPNFMKEPINGEETYIYLEKTEVNSWFGEILESKIRRCDTTMELYNIASFVEYETGRVELILNHPLCDRGIATMLFWRLKTYCATIWNSTDSILHLIIERIKNNEYPEIIAYNPKLDNKINIKEIKPKWEIPQKLKQPI